MTDLDKNSIWDASLLDEEINKSAIVHISERISIGEELDALAFLEKNPTSKIAKLMRFWIQRCARQSPESLI